MISKEFLENYGNIKIYLVDEEEIRDSSELLEEFSNYGIHSDFKIIPDNQIWLSKTTDSDERFFLINEALNRIKYELAGLTNKQAYVRALKKDMASRTKKINSEGISPPSPGKIPEKVYLKHYGMIKNLEVWIVDGDLVRDWWKTDFVEGGQSVVYHWIPENEIWIDRETPQNDRKFVILHEIVERELMKNKKMTYNKAHEKAAKIEWRVRSNDMQNWSTQ